MKRSLPNGVATAWSFDAAGRLTGLTSSHNGDVIDMHAYVPDAVGNITQDTANGLVMIYQDDDLYRLVQATIGGTTTSWVYDLAGNRLSQTVGTNKTVYGFDGANRMTSVNGAPLAYDANGNLIAYGSDAYTWDVRDRMSGLTRPGLAASFIYDYSGRRSSKTINSTKTSFLYDGTDIVSEISGGSTINTQQSPFTDEPIKRNGLYLTPNHLGSTTTLTDSNGSVAEQYFYLPFGQTSQSVGTSSPFQFTGRENDGTGLYDFRARYYSPDLGRFISEDPIGFSGGPNQYAYANDDPENANDPSGLVPLAWGAAGGAAAAEGVASATPPGLIVVGGALATYAAYQASSALAKLIFPLPSGLPSPASAFTVFRPTHIMGGHGGSWGFPSFDPGNPDPNQITKLIYKLTTFAAAGQAAVYNGRDNWAYFAYSYYGQFQEVFLHGPSGRFVIVAGGQITNGWRFVADPLTETTALQQAVQFFTGSGRGFTAAAAEAALRRVGLR